MPVREQQLPTPPRCPAFHTEGLCQALFRRGSCRSLFHERPGAGVAGLQKAAASLLGFSPCTEVLRSRKKKEGLRNRGGGGGTCTTQKLLLTAEGLLTLFCCLLFTFPRSLRFLKFIPQDPLAQNCVAGVTCKTVQCNTFFKSQMERQERT